MCGIVSGYSIVATNKYRHVAHYVAASPVVGLPLSYYNLFFAPSPAFSAPFSVPPPPLPAPPSPYMSAASIAATRSASAGPPSASPGPAFPAAPASPSPGPPAIGHGARSPVSWGAAGRAGRPRI